MMEKLQLKMENHSKPYKLSWLKKGNEVCADKWCLVKLSIGEHYKYEILCDVVPMMHAIYFFEDHGCTIEGCYMMALRTLTQWLRMASRSHWHLVERRTSLNLYIKRSSFLSTSQILLAYTFVIKPKVDTQNQVANALSRWCSLISSMEMSVIGFEVIKELYEEDPYFFKDLEWVF